MQDKLLSRDFQRLFENAPGLYLVLRPDLTIVAVSDAYLGATMTQRQDIIGHKLFDIFPDNPDDLDATGTANLRTSLDRVLKDRMPHAMPVQKYDIKRPESDGGGFEVRYWSPLNTPVFDGGDVVYIIHRVEDVTEFIQLKQQGTEQSLLTEELRTRAGQMEAEIYKRAQQVEEANRKLRAANEELARLYAKSTELDQIKTQFFANVSHELRTPLSLILGPVQKLQSSPRISDAERHDLEIVERNGRMLLKHVNDLLDIAKLEAGEMHIHYATVDVASLTRFVASYFESLGDDKQIHFSVQTPPELVIDADPSKIRRILVNLLSNAFKFTPRAGKIAIRLEADSTTVTVSVGDNGPGIPEQQREQVFERFRQLNGGANRTVGGTGLGLSIVKQFASLHNGTVQVGTSEDGGALFTLKIPKAAPDGVAVERAEIKSDMAEDIVADVISPDVLPADDPLSNTKPLILVVEDNADMRSFIVSTLSDEYRIVTAPDGLRGRDLALKFVPDLILTDVMMPYMTGDELVRDLRTHSDLEGVPIIVLTAKADQQLRVRLLQDGAQDFLDKPFSPEELQARIARLVHERRRTQQIILKTEAWRKAFLRDMLRSVTQGKLTICSSEEELPVRVAGPERAVELANDSLRDVRVAVAEVATLLGFDTVRTYELKTAASEAAMNAVVHSGGGMASVYVSSQNTVQVWIEDDGCGIDIDQLPQATLEKGYSTAGSLGHGFFLILNCIDRLYLLTGPDGTKIVLEKSKTEPEPAWMNLRSGI